jgi:GTP cyclohydrolase II
MRSSFCFRAYNLQDLGHDTVTANILLQHPPDKREYECAVLILQDLNLSQIRLLTNNPDKLEKLEASGISVTRRIPMVPSSWCEQQISSPSSLSETTTKSRTTEMDYYLLTKIERMRHILELPPHLLQ